MHELSIVADLVALCEKALNAEKAKKKGAAEQGGAEALALHEGVHIQGIELGFLQIKLEKALDMVLKFDHPQELAFVFEGIEVAVGAEQGKPGLQHGFAVVAGAGVAHGVLVGVVDVFAILDACRTQVGNQAHNGRGVR